MVAKGTLHSLGLNEERGATRPGSTSYKASYGVGAYSLGNYSVGVYSMGGYSVGGYRGPATDFGCGS